MNFSLVIPCFNEANNLPSLMEKCKKVLENKDNEIILVDNGSTDNSESILKAYLDIYPNLKIVKIENNIGYGNGILKGLEAARGAFLGWTHADLQTNPEDVLKGLEFLKNDHTFVKGKRFGRPLFDRIFTVFMSIFETILLGKILSDINAQPTIFSRKFFETWENPPNDFSLDLFAYYLAKKNKLSIARFPVFFGKRLHGTSHWNIDFKSKLKFINRTIKYSFKLRINLQ